MFAEGTASFTQALREAPHEQLARPVEIRRVRRSSLAGRAQVSVAAAVALMAVGLASQFGSSSVADAGSLGTVSQFQTRAELERELALIQLSQAHGPSSADPVL